MGKPVTRVRFQQLAMVLFASSVLWGLSPAQTATRGNQSAAQKQYQEDRALCESGMSSESKATCLKEAGAALNAARSGKLGAGASTDYRQNELARCQVLPPADRPSCEAMIREGQTRGSVESGGIYREYRETVPAGGANTR